MNNARTVFHRPDTFFGVCEAIGQDFGFNSNYVRIVFGISVLLAPAAVIATYAALGAMVFVSRRLHPAVRPAATTAAQPAGAVAPRSDNDGETAPLALAA